MLYSFETTHAYPLCWGKHGTNIRFPLVMLGHDRASREFPTPTYIPWIPVPDQVEDRLLRGWHWGAAHMKKTGKRVDNSLCGNRIAHSNWIASFVRMEHPAVCSKSLREWAGEVAAACLGFRMKPQPHFLAEALHLVARKTPPSVVYDMKKSIGLKAVVICGTFLYLPGLLYLAYFYIWPRLV